MRQNPSLHPAEIRQRLQSDTVIVSSLAGLLLVAVLIRVPTLFQSLWYDEMFTLINYIGQDWGNIVSGQYSPNNHVLFTLAAKLASLGQSDVEGLTISIRLPSLVAGSLIPVALAWPMM